MHPELTSILDEARSQIARGIEPDVATLESRIRPLDPDGRALGQLRRLLAVHRAKRSLATDAPQRPQARPAVRRDVYRAKPTVAANMTVRARAEGSAVVLEWQPAKGVEAWEARVSERPDARSQYVDRATQPLDAPRLELRLTDLPQRVSITGRNAAGRIVQRALVSGLTSANWNQRWQQRASAS
ncbi:MAG TPA: hypothetical protein VGK79_14135 [Gaiellaceae bacterium]